MFLILKIQCTIYVKAKINQVSKVKHQIESELFFNSSLLYISPKTFSSQYFYFCTVALIVSQLFYLYEFRLVLFFYLFMSMK